MNRGSTVLANVDVAKRQRFNEAPIHESGKSRPPLLSAIRTPCFNEAPIHESGK